MRLLLSLFSLTAGICCFNAYADNVFLVQLGSYQSEKDSEMAWKEVTQTFKDDFRQLSHQHSVLALPPSGKKVFRLQSGPFPLRNEATSFCDKMRGKGQDCFVVESAAFAPKDAARQVVVKETPVEAPAEKAVKQESAIAEPSKMPATLPDTRKGLMVMGSAAAKEIAETPAVIAKSAPATIAATAANTPPATPEAAAKLPSMAALEPPSFSLTSPVRPDAVKNEFADAFDKTPVTADTIEDTKPKTLPAPVKQVAKPIEKTVEVAKNKIATPMVKNPVPVSKPVTRPAPAPQITTAPPAAPAMAAKAPDSLPFAIVDRKTGKQVLAPNSKRLEVNPPPPASAVANNTPTVQPAPTKAVEQQEVAMAKPENAAPQPPVKTAAQTTSPEASSPYVAGREPKSLSMQVASTQPDSANVAAPRRMTSGDRISPTDRRVEIDEAIPVPLSEAPKKPTETAPAEVATTTESGAPVLSGKHPMAWRSTPSRSLMQKAYWVQLSHFSSDQAALNYWQSVRNKFPKTTDGMRMRITRPLQAAKSLKRVSLQVGPFLEESDVSELCSFVSSENITCQMAKDIGVSTTAGAPRQRISARSYQDRRDILMMRPSVGEARYWLQLGSYRTQEDAKIAWDELHDTQPALTGYQPSLVKPKLSSSTQEIYRLRTGPFQIRPEAEDLCKRLQDVEIGCVIVSE